MHELKKRSLPYAQEHSGLCPDFVALVQKWLKSLQVSLMGIILVSVRRV